MRPNLIAHIDMLAIHQSLIESRLLNYRCYFFYKRGYLETISNVLCETIRPIVIQQTSIDVLGELVEILNVEILDEIVNRKGTDVLLSSSSFFFFIKK